MFEDSEDVAGFFETEDGFALTAIYRVDGLGGGTVIPVLPSRPDRGVSLFGQETVSVTGGFLIRVSDVKQPAAGDTISVSGVIYTVQGEPLRDDTRVLWSVEGRES